MDDKKKLNLFVFSKGNYKYLLIGLAINVLGFILMIGGAADDLDKFDANELFHPVRITIAPIVIVAGYIIILYAIMKRRKIEEKSKTIEK